LVIKEGIAKTKLIRVSLSGGGFYEYLEDQGKTWRIPLPSLAAGPESNKGHEGGFRASRSSLSRPPACMSTIMAQG